MAALFLSSCTAPNCEDLGDFWDVLGSSFQPYEQTAPAEQKHFADCSAPETTLDVPRIESVSGLGFGFNAGALIIRIGIRGPLYHNNNKKKPQNSTGNY